MRIFLLSLICFVASFDAMAGISVFKRDQYDRIVIEPIAAGALNSTNNLITIPYKNKINEQDKSKIISNSRIIKSISSDKKSLKLELFNGVEDTRHFQIGNKVVLDVFFDTKKIEKVKTKTPKLIEPIIAKKEKIKIKSTAIKPVIVQEKKLKVVEEKSPEFKDDHYALPLADPTILTISSTSNFGLSVFKRLGRLFIVTDQETMAVPPQISGHGADIGWELKEIPITGGKAWIMNIPKNTYLRPEGRGLIWRVVISDINPHLKTSDIRRRLIDKADPKIDILMANSSKLLRLNDPDYGDDFAVVTVTQSNSRMRIPYNFVDFDILPAIVGAVIKPKSDGVRILAANQFITISKNDKLTVASEPQNKIIEAYLRDGKEKIKNNITKTTLDRIYYFADWGAGIEPYEYLEKRKELDQFLVLAPKDSKLGILLNLVKLTLSQGMGHESLGYLDIAKNINPQIVKTAEYKALRGAAHYLSSQFDVAIKYFNDDELAGISEILLWKSATLSSLGLNKKSVKSYQDNAVLSTVYPYEIRRRVIAPLAKSILDMDDGDSAQAIISLIEHGIEDQSLEARATVAYLKGRAQSLTGRPDEAISSLYQASISDKLGPYGIRSELLLVKDELDREVITKDEAIQRMERLRFAWRGDTLESEIQKELGHLYIENKMPRRGLNILKGAARNTNSTKDRRKIVRTMANAYKTIFIGDKFADLDPMTAIAVYDEFKELTPVGVVGNDLIDRLADKLMSINLLSRATTVLKDKMDRLETGEHAIKTGLRISAIQLIDRSPKKAKKILSQIDKMMSSYKGDNKDDLNNKIVLLKARAFSDSGNPQQALFMMEGLDDTDDVINLRIDTAWRSGHWVAVTDNLSKLLSRQNITSSSPPTKEQTQLILNQAVALSLSDQYDALQRFASDYDGIMKQSVSYKTFKLVSRPQNISSLADRDTLMSVTSEVDLFKDFLENIK